MKWICQQRQEHEVAACSHDNRPEVENTSKNPGDRYNYQRTNSGLTSGCYAPYPENHSTIKTVSQADNWAFKCETVQDIPYSNLNKGKLFFLSLGTKRSTIKIFKASFCHSLSPRYRRLTSWHVWLRTHKLLFVALRGEEGRGWRTRSWGYDSTHTVSSHIILLKCCSLLPRPHPRGLI